MDWIIGICFCMYYLFIQIGLMLILRFSYNTPKDFNLTIMKGLKEAQDLNAKQQKEYFNREIDSLKEIINRR